MPQETLKSSVQEELSPVHEARARLSSALEQLGNVVELRLKKAEHAVLTAASQAKTNDDSEQWQNACQILEEQSSALREENSRLHDELHAARLQHEKLKAVTTSISTTLDETIAQVETVLKS